MRHDQCVLALLALLAAWSLGATACSDVTGPGLRDAGTDGDADGDSGGSDGAPEGCEARLVSWTITHEDELDTPLPEAPEVSVGGLSFTARWAEGDPPCAGIEAWIELEDMGSSLFLRHFASGNYFSCEDVPSLLEATIEVCRPGHYALMFGGAPEVVDVVVP